MRVDYILTGIYLFAVAQGLALCLGLLIIGSKTNRANRTLALIIGLITLYVTGKAVYTSGLMASAPHFVGFRYPLLFSFGPLIYLYTRLMVGRGGWTGSASALHFLPLLLALALNLPVIGLSLEEKQSYVQEMIYGAVDLPTTELYRLLWGSSGWAHLALYCLAAIGLLRQHGRRIVHEFSSLSRISLNWLRVLVGLCLASGTLGFLLTWGSLLQGYALVNPTTRFIELLLISLIYAVGYMGFWQPVIFQRPGSIDPEASPLSRSSATETSTPQATVANRESAAITGEQAIDKYEKSSLTPSAVEAYKEMLLEAMVGELLFLDNELNLASLAERLEMSPHHLSQVINASMGINFFEFINHYRVEYAKKCLCDPQRDGDTIINIAMAAGFNNKTSFNQAFKKSTALTPSQYRKQHLH